MDKLEIVREIEKALGMDKFVYEPIVEIADESIENNNTGLVRPFLKWAGGKLKLVKTLTKKFPANGKRYIEPFLGAGSVALNVDYPVCIVNDTNSDLMSVWTFLKQMGLEFVNECEKLFVSANNNEEVFNALRVEFNTTKNKLRKAVLFIYLMRHCFNGLCRYNSKGEYNVPIGDYKNPYFPRKEFEQCLDKVKTFEIYNKDFREIFKMVEADDVVYCDPPYMPISLSANFENYASGGFSFKDQIELAECAAVAADEGATVVISNQYNWYSKGLYNIYNGKLSKIQVSRTINSVGNKRVPVEELIVVFQKD